MGGGEDFTTAARLVVTAGTIPDASISKVEADGVAAGTLFVIEVDEGVMVCVWVWKGTFTSRS